MSNSQTPSTIREAFDPAVFYTLSDHLASTLDNSTEAMTKLLDKYLELLTRDGYDKNDIARIFFILGLGTALSLCCD